MTTGTDGARRTGLWIVLALFVLLGLPEGTLGPAWPSIRDQFGQPVSALAWLSGLYVTGYLASTTASGHLAERFGVGRTIRGAALLAALGLAMYAVAPAWPVVVAAALLTGLGAGTVDATGNTYVAVVGTARSMNLLHAGFGLGATMGPLGVTLVLEAGGSWRVVYGAAAVLQLLTWLVATRHRRSLRVPAEDREAGGPRPRMRGSALIGLLTIQFFYVAAEVGYAHWSFSVLTDDRGVDRTVAGLAAAGFWAGLTGGRLALGALGPRIGATRVLSASLVAAVVAAVVFWTEPVDGVDVVALPVLGVSMAGVFPALVLLTPVWLGEENTARAVGYQLAAASLGAIVVSAILGASVRSGGLDVVAWILVLVTAAVGIAYWATLVVVGRDARLR